MLIGDVLLHVCCVVLCCVVLCCVVLCCVVFARTFVHTRRSGASWGSRPHATTLRSRVRRRHALVSLRRQSHEYEAVAALFNASCPPNTRVVSVERVQNPSLWAAYRNRIAELTMSQYHHWGGLGEWTGTPTLQLVAPRETSARGGLVPHSEMMLWHGTYSDNVPSICDQGFNPLFTERTLYGRGSYFSRHAAAACCYRGTHSHIDYQQARKNNTWPTGPCCCRPCHAAWDRGEATCERGRAQSDSDASRARSFKTGELLLARVATCVVSTGCSTLRAPGTRSGGVVWDTAVDELSEKQCATDSTSPFTLGDKVVVFHPAQAFPAYRVRYAAYTGCRACNTPCGADCNSKAPFPPTLQPPMPPDQCSIGVAPPSARFVDTPASIEEGRARRRQKAN